MLLLRAVLIGAALVAISLAIAIVGVILAPILAFAALVGAIWFILKLIHAVTHDPDQTRD